MDVRQVQGTKLRSLFSGLGDLSVDILNVVVILKRNRLRSQDVLDYLSQINLSDDWVFAPSKHLVADAVLGSEVLLDYCEQRLTELLNELRADRETMSQST